MRIRTIALILAAVIPGASYAFLPIGTFYYGPTIQVQLGDICDAVRFPATPGTCSGGAGDPDWRLEIETALARWNSAQTNFVFTTDPGVGASTPGSCLSGDPRSTFFLPDICGVAFGGSTLAVARTSSGLDRRAVHSDVIFNTAFTWGAYDDARANHPGVQDFRRTAVHEFGHVLGLNHPFTTSAIMYFASQDLIDPQPDDLAGSAAIYGATIVRTADDQNGNGVNEIIHLRRSVTGDVRASIWDPGTGAELASLTYFTGGFVPPSETVQPVDAVVIPDQDGDGNAELAVLGFRNSNLKPVVEIQNIAGAPAVRRVPFMFGFRPVRLRDIGDADGDGNSELAVLGVRESDNRVLVQIRNSIGAPAERTIYFADLTTAHDMEVIIDPLGVAPPRLAVLLTRLVNLAGMVELRNAFGPQARADLFGRQGVRPRLLALVGDGSAQVAVLGVRTSNGRPEVELHNVTGSPVRSVLRFKDGFTPLDFSVADDADGDGNREVMMLSRRDADGLAFMQVQNTDHSNLRVLMLTSAGLDTAGSMTTLGDVDADGFDEVAVLMSRQTDARMRADLKNIAGPNTGAAAHVWVSVP